MRWPSTSATTPSEGASNIPGTHTCIVVWGYRAVGLGCWFEVARVVTEWQKSAAVQLLANEMRDADLRGSSTQKDSRAAEG